MDNNLNNLPLQQVTQPEPLVSPNYNLVILDDNYVIRNIVKNEIYTRIVRFYPDIDFDVFSSDDGVGGLGYIYLTKPKIIVVDTTLPRYSGREIFEFLQSNKNYVIEHTLVILISEYKYTLENLPTNFVILEKSHSNFLNQLVEYVLKHVLLTLGNNKVNPEEVRVNTSILPRIILFFANIGDKINNPRAFSKNILFLLLKPFLWIIWVLFEFLIAPLYVIYNITIGNLLGESQIKSSTKDINFRSNKRPHFISVLINISLTVVKLMLFLLINIIILLISREI